MAQFMYTAVRKSGEKISGTVDATSESEARVVLRSQQLRPIKITQAGAFNFDLAKLFSGSVGTVDVLMFTRQLSILISSGVPLVQSLEIISDQIKNPAMKSVVMVMKEKISGGAFLWESMKSFNHVFPEIYVSMVRAGEAAGALDTIFKRLIKYLDDAFKLNKMIKGAMIYPIAVITISIAVVCVMMVFVIPKFEELLKTSGRALPEPTRIVINMSHFVQSNIIYMIIVGVVSYFLFKTWVSTKEGRENFDYYVLKVPVFGALILKTGVARFSRTMQTMLSSGINVLDALSITQDAVGNKTISNAVLKIRADVEQGKTLSAAMSKAPIFPSMAVQMVTVGESTGNLDKMLERVAEYFEEEIQNFVSNLTKLIEPFILVFLGVMVGGLMIAMYLPIFNLAG